MFCRSYTNLNSHQQGMHTPLWFPDLCALVLLPVRAACALLIEPRTVEAFEGGAGTWPSWFSALSLVEDDILLVVRVRSWRVIIHGPGGPGLVPAHWWQQWVPRRLATGPVGSEAGVCSLAGGGEPPHSCVLSMGVPLGLVVQTSGQVSASTNWPEGGLKTGTCLHQCPHGRTRFQNWLLPASVPSTLGLPACLLSLQEALQDQQVGLTQAFFRLLPLCWLLEHVRFCLCPLGAMFSCNPSALQYTSPTVLKPRFCGSSWLWGRISRLESPTWGLDPLLLGKSICSFDYPSISGLPTQRCGSYIYHISASPTCLTACRPFFISVVEGKLYCEASGCFRRQLLCK